MSNAFNNRIQSDVQTALNSIMATFTDDSKQMLANDPTTNIVIWAEAGKCALSAGTIDSKGNLSALYAQPYAILSRVKLILNLVSTEDTLNMQLRPVPILVIPPSLNIPTQIEILSDSVNLTNINAVLNRELGICNLIDSDGTFRIDIAITDKMKAVLGPMPFSGMNTVSPQPMDLSSFMPKPTPSDCSRAVPTAVGSGTMPSYPRIDFTQAKIDRYDNSILPHNHTFEDFKTLMKNMLLTAAAHLKITDEIPNDLIDCCVQRIGNLNHQDSAFSKIEFILRGYYNCNATTDDAFRATVAVIRAIKELILEESQIILNRSAPYPKFHEMMMTAKIQQSQESFKDAVFKTLPRAAEQFIIAQGDSKELISYCVKRIMHTEHLPAVAQILKSYAAKGFPEAHVMPACMEILDTIKRQVLAESNQQIHSDDVLAGYATDDTFGNEQFLQQQYNRQADLAEQISDENYKNSFSISQMHDQTLHGGGNEPAVDPTLDPELLAAMEEATRHTEATKHCKPEDLPISNQSDRSKMTHQANPLMEEHLSKVENHKFEAEKSQILRDVDIDDLQDIFSKTEGVLEDVISPRTKVDMNIKVIHCDEMITLSELEARNTSDGVDSLFFVDILEFEKHTSEADKHKICYIVMPADEMVYVYVATIDPNNALKSDWGLDATRNMRIVNEIEVSEVKTKNLSSEEFDDMFTVDD